VEVHIPTDGLSHQNELAGEPGVAVSRLRAFAVFEGLSEEALAEIAANCQQEILPPESVIIREGQVGSEVYLLEEGTVGIYRGDPQEHTFIVTLHPPTLFGERALLDPERIRTASVKAVTALRLIVLKIDFLLSVLRRYPVLKDNLRQLIASRR